ncbi:MAG: saccharopine dehydrogenase NADP-binding domain-containing protein [Methanobacteriota archaeon]|nr:MAG: saccharopine dehydrogenase NADP-binding domain-containing protein [Euryarchaeota archaeon]
MKVLVVGASGQIGAMSVSDLVASYKADVVAADIDLRRVKEVAKSTNPNRVTPIDLDARDAKAMAKALKGVDVVMNSAWYELNMDIMNAAIKAGVHYTDLGGFYDGTLRQLKLTKKAKDAGVTCVLGIGSTPGITNVCGAAGADRLDSVKDILIYCTWGTKAESTQAGMPAYSIRTVLDEMTQEPGIVENGRKKKVPILSGETSVVMPEPSGEVVAHYIKHSEPATMADFIGKGTKHVSFRIGFPDTDFATFKTLAELGFASEKPLDIGGGCKCSPKDYITAMYTDAVANARKSTEAVDEYDYLRVDVTGRKDRLPARCTYLVRTWNDRKTGLSSARDTSVPPSITANWLATGKIKERGVLPPEACIDPKPFFRELGKRKIRVDEEMQVSSKFY